MFKHYPVFNQLDERPTAHCATLTVLPDGTLFTAWFGGAYETAPNVAILGAQLQPGNEQWHSPRILAEVPGRSLGQPVFLVRPDSELWLFFVVIMGNDWTTAQPYWQRSKDGGVSWYDCQPLMDYPGLMFRSKPLILPGRIILPVYDENTWQSRMLISDDDGQTWRLTAPLSSPQGNIHACLAPLTDGRLLAYMRTGGKGGVVWRAESFDQGDTWTELTPTRIPNPNSGIDLLRLQSGRLVLAFNNSATMRTPLCVALAGTDEIWERAQTLEDARAEFSYPTLLQTGDGLIHIVYTYKRETIYYASFDEDWLAEGELHLG